MDTIDLRSLNPFDWFLVGVLAYSTIMAFVRGFFRESFSLVGLIAGVLLASWYYPVVGSRLAQWIPWSTAQLISFLLIAVTVMVLFGLGGSLVSRTAKTIGLGFVDRALGAVFGFARGCLLGVLILMGAAAFFPQEKYIRDSQLSGYFLEGAHAVSFVVPANLQQHIRQGAFELQHRAPDWIKR
jgi:membrane protein required for colicin V production